MIKDPNHSAETPYELLNLSPSASSAAVRAALPRFMKDRRNIARLGQAQEAVRKLQNGKARAAVDIWYYQFEPESGASGDEAGALQEKVERFAAPPVLPPEELYCDLDAAGFAADERPIEFVKVKYSEIRAFDGLDAIAVRPQFDR